MPRYNTLGSFEYSGSSCRDRIFHLLKDKTLATLGRATLFNQVSYRPLNPLRDYPRFGHSRMPRLDRDRMPVQIMKNEPVLSQGVVHLRTASHPRNP